MIFDDPDGMRVERTAVVAVRPDGDGWTVETLAGTERVDEQGEGPRLVPLDAQMAAEFDDRGASFVIRSTVDELDQDVDPSYDWHRYEQQLGRDVERDRDQGRER
jgi:hypothetical protein